jgi:two-component system LytT family response regulator
VFLDVQLRGATAFELVPRIRPEARIVFVTAHDRYAVRAFEVNALDYLLKPLSPERLAETIERILAAFAQAERRNAGGEGEPEEPAPPRLAPDDIVFLRTGMQGRFVPVADISIVEAEQNYSAVGLADGSRLLLRRTMKSWEDILPPTHFMRVHRTAIANLSRVVRYERDREERTRLFLEGVKDPATATRKLWPELQEKFTQLRRAI